MINLFLIIAFWFCVLFTRSFLINCNSEETPTSMWSYLVVCVCLCVTFRPYEISKFSDENINWLRSNLRSKNKLKINFWQMHEIINLHKLNRNTYQFSLSVLFTSIRFLLSHMTSLRDIRFLFIWCFCIYRTSPNNWTFSITEN